MKKILAKIWVPSLLVLAAAVQSFGIDAARTMGFSPMAHAIHRDSSDFRTDTTEAEQLPKDSLIIDTLSVDSLTIDSLAIDSLSIDSLITDSLASDPLVQDTVILLLSARDTIKVPDSLRETDPFFYKYYIAIKDSLTRAEVRDSLIQAGDTLELMKLDSLYIKDSTEVAIAKFNAWYASLSKRERKKYDAEQALPGLIAKARRKQEIKDSIRAYKDSVIAATPRILETYAFPDSMHYKRIVTWKHDTRFHNLVELRDQSADTSLNYNFYDYAFMKEDVNATWQGTSGSPVQLYSFMKREEEKNSIFFTPYMAWTYSPETLPMYNSKTPYTELGYSGTLFANTEKEEMNVKFLTTQNITPELNLTLMYTRFGSNGMLRNEDVSNRNLVVATNYVGKKYQMHAGYIWNKIHSSENGGIKDLFWIRDTTVDSREIEVYLNKAASESKKQTLFLDQSYRIPLTFIEDLRNYKENKREQAVRDSIMASGDSVAIADLKFRMERELAAEAAKPDTVVNDITTAFIGHSSEYTVYSRSYQDEILANEKDAREFFNNRFYLNPTKSNDSLRVMRFENRAFIRLQPWADDAIVSKLDVGIGDRLLNYFSFSPIDYIKGSQNKTFNSVYLYAGIRGQYDKYLQWSANGDYTFAGHELNDFSLDADISFSMYPFRKNRKSPLTIGAKFETNLREPDYYQQHMYTNHYMWNNDFGKISTTKIEANLDIPHWRTHANVGYSLLGNNIYYDTLGIIRQNTKPMSVLSASLRQDFKIWKFHLEHQALLQYSSDRNVLPLPALALNFRYYFQFDVVKNVMKMQVGANALYTTKWNAPAYNPVIGVFHNQNVEEYGNCPYIDAFVNIQWKQASIFIKVVNLNMGWPNKSVDYFTSHGHIATQRAVKFGISWPFWKFAGNGSTNNRSSGSSSGSVGNQRNSSGMGGGSRGAAGGGMSRGGNMRTANRR
ncbi:MAG: hypothetical protein E7118_02860 [Bacteroidales bacterium]|nr:hypothetical protein [Bacteroidales bacterium]